MYVCSLVDKVMDNDIAARHQVVRTTRFLDGPLKLKQARMLKANPRFDSLKARLESVCIRNKSKNHNISYHQASLVFYYKS